MVGRAQLKDPLDGLNPLERAYAQHLQERLSRGEIARWEVHPEKLRLADLTYYTPDFRVLGPDGEVQFHETKGFMRDDANVKLKVAAELHPYRFFLIKKKTKREGGGWNITEVRS